MAVKHLLLALVFVALSLSLFLGFVLTAVFLPPPQRAGKIEVKVERGEPFSSVVRKLKDRSVITSEKLFSFWARLRGLDKKIHWGFYRFELPLAPAAALDQMIPERGLFSRVTVPEGLTLREVADLLEKAEIARKERLLAEAASQELLSQLELEGKGIEGYLFPDTYYFPPSTTEREILIEMVEQFHDVFNSMMQEQSKELGLTPHEVVIIASLIEKETGVESERPLVSAVFHNRLKIKMPLQSDPTVIYGLPNFSGNLTRKNLQSPSSYNTYRIKGLPPGPICNPGLSSLKAALSPAPTPYLYFVSKNDGSHFFSVDLKDHNQAVKLYQGGGRRAGGP